jgi:hypothetical protein
VLWDALQVEKKRGEAKREAEAVKCEQRGREVAQRRLNRAELEGKQLAEQLPGLQNTVANMEAQLAAEQRQAGREVAAGRKLAAEVAAMVGEVAVEKQLVSDRRWEESEGVLMHAACMLPTTSKAEQLQAGRQGASAACMHGAAQQTSYILSLPLLACPAPQSEAQTALVKASLVYVRQLDEECADLHAAAAERQKAIRAAVSQRDAAVRFLNQRLKRQGRGGAACPWPAGRQGRD